MEHDENILNPNKGQIPSLLRVFAMFDLRIFDNRDKAGAIAIKPVNSK